VFASNVEEKNIDRTSQ